MIEYNSVRSCVKQTLKWLLENKIISIWNNCLYIYKQKHKNMPSSWQFSLSLFSLNDILRGAFLHHSVSLIYSGNLYFCHLSHFWLLCETFLFPHWLWTQWQWNVSCSQLHCQCPLHLALSSFLIYVCWMKEWKRGIKENYQILSFRIKKCTGLLYSKFPLTSKKRKKEKDMALVRFTKFVFQSKQHCSSAGRKFLMSPLLSVLLQIVNYLQSHKVVRILGNLWR